MRATGKVGRRGGLLLSLWLGASACSSSTVTQTPGAGGGGAGGAGGAAGDPEPVAAPDCTKGETIVTGAVDGTAVDGVFEPFLVVLEGTARAQWSIDATGHHDTLGGFALRPLGEPGETVATTGVLHLPPAGPLGEAFFCAGEGTSMVRTADGRIQATLRSLGRIGACPGGEPVADELTACLVGWEDSASCAAHGVTGTLGGETLDVPIEPELTIADPASGDLAIQAFLPGVGSVAIATKGFDGGTLGESTRPLDAGYVVAPSTGSDPGAVYCVGGGTITYRYDGFALTPIEASVGELRRLGSCEGASVAGEVGICSYL
ncbi:MAG: hypothetical protein KC731_42095 [Myxococcales bacterium]|nr:hypothetical protein [Myxococcales bacterium]